MWVGGASKELFDHLALTKDIKMVDIDKMSDVSAFDDDLLENQMTDRYISTFIDKYDVSTNDYS